MENKIMGQIQWIYANIYHLRIWTVAEGVGDSDRLPWCSLDICVAPFQVHYAIDKSRGLT